ncbi:MAG: ribosome-associated translation inhibitor RaiA [Longimicrobiales bacterium]|nr:ribosome-associated translation inhibitor RaiA [Longimicrobiales bacterium]
MRITVTERHCQVSKRVRDRTESLVGGLSKYEERASAAEVVYSDEKHTKKVEIIVHIDGAPHVVARGEGEDFRSALDRAVDRTKRILRDQREQRRDHQAPPLSETMSGE